MLTLNVDNTGNSHLTVRVLKSFHICNGSWNSMQLLYYSPLKMNDLQSRLTFGCGKAALLSLVMPHCIACI